MTSPTAPPPAAPPPAAPPDPGGGQPPTVAELDSKIEALRETLQAYIGQGHDQAADRTASRLDRPSVVERQVRQELERLQEERERKAAEDGRDATIKSQGDQLAELRRQLAEAPPAEPVRLVTRLLWGNQSKQPAGRKAGTA